jgi:outer membrane protein
MRRLSVCAAALLMSAPVLAGEAASPVGAGAGDWVITYRATGVITDAHDPITTSAGAATGLSADVGSDYMPTLGFTYFLSDNFAIEAILGATKHDIRAQGGATDVLVHDTWVLPPIVTLQYRPMPRAQFSPYVGAGLNVMLFFGGDDHNGFQVDLDNGVGYVLQAGADIAINDRWLINLDVKKVWFETDASINGGSLVSNVAIDPWVVSVGLGYKF